MNGIITGWPYATLHFTLVTFHYYVPGLHHFHRRKRLVEGRPENRLIRIFDKFIYVVAIMGPLTTLPQMIKIWSTQNAQGVSAFTWCAYLVTNLFWLTYGIIHHERPIALTYTLWFLVNGSVALGAILYG